MDSIKIILASKSPRRIELITKLGFSHEVRSFDFDETYSNKLNRYDVPVFLALKKSKQVESLLKDEVLLTADTVVIHKDEILEKPSSLLDAKKMLSTLSDSSHDVVTGVCLKSNSKTIQFSVKTKVKFSSLSSDEIEHYVNNYKPTDKSGAYGIQEWIGMIGVKEIQGSYYNVVGLPVHEIYTSLKKNFI